MAYKSIGIFDSGIGGLTVAKAINQLCPNENLLYIGDTAHAPWGDKSTKNILLYSTKIVDFFLEQNCKAIVIACNSASVSVTEHLKKYTNNKLKIFNVIEPMIKFVNSNHKNQNLCLLGTKQTVNSKAYQNKIKNLTAIPTPLLAPLVEEGFADNIATHFILKEYLNKIDFKTKNITALILACTHYPLLKNQIQNIIGNKINLLDSAELLAAEIKDYLNINNLNNQQNNNKKGNLDFYITDHLDFFEKQAKLFFPNNLNLKQLPLWD